MKQLVDSDQKKDHEEKGRYAPLCVCVCVCVCVCCIVLESVTNHVLTGIKSVVLTNRAIVTRNARENRRLHILSWQTNPVEQRRLSVPQRDSIESYPGELTSEWPLSHETMTFRS